MFHGLGRRSRQDKALEVHMPKASIASCDFDEAAERRLSPRQTMILRVGLLAHGERSTFCLVKNISPMGAQLRLYGQVAEGISVTLAVGDEDPVRGQIAWAKDGTAGVEFENPLDATTLLRAMQKLPATKRRSSPRVKTAAHALLRTGGRSYPGQLLDVSAVGARVRTPRPIRIGPSIMVTLPDLPTIKAFVRWNEETELGLAFNEPLPIQLLAEWMNDRVNLRA
jgi:hypothetical protein